MHTALPACNKNHGNVYGNDSSHFSQASPDATV